MAHVHSAECSCAHEAKEQDIDFGDSLYGAIDTVNIRALNADDAGDAAKPFKPHQDRLDDTKVLRSDEDDGDLIVHVPFTAQVVLKSFCIIGGGNGSAPAHVRVWKNRDDIDFTNAAAGDGGPPPTQEFDLQYDAAGEINYPVRINKFQAVSSLTFFFDKNHRDGELGDDDDDAEFTQLNFVGLRGATTDNKRQPILGLVYESRANPQDHKTEGDANTAGPSFGQ